MRSTDQAMTSEKVCPFDHARHVKAQPYTQIKNCHHRVIHGSGDVCNELKNASTGCSTADCCLVPT